MNPEFFEFTFDNGISKIDYIQFTEYKRGLSDRKNNSIINPFRWINALLTSYFSGNKHSKYRIEHIQMDLINKVLDQNEEDVAYHLNNPYLINSIYYAINGEINED